MVTVRQVGILIVLVALCVSTLDAQYFSSQELSSLSRNGKDLNNEQQSMEKNFVSLPRRPQSKKLRLRELLSIVKVWDNYKEKYLNNNDQ